MLQWRNCEMQVVRKHRTEKRGPPYIKAKILM